MIEIIVPVLYEDMETAILKWNKQVGDIIESGDLLFCLETDKANFDVEAEENGTLVEVKAKLSNFVFTHYAALPSAPGAPGNLAHHRPIRNGPASSGNSGPQDTAHDGVGG